MCWNLVLEIVLPCYRELAEFLEEGINVFPLLCTNALQIVFTLLVPKKLHVCVNMVWWCMFVYVLQEYGVEAYYGPLQIAYRESISDKSTESCSLDRRIADTHHTVTVSLSVKLSSDVTWKTGSTKRPKFHVCPAKDSTLAEKPLPRHYIKAIEIGITSGLSKGNHFVTAFTFAFAFYSY